MAGLYIHIPFCVRKCLYCDFYSIPLGEGPLPDRLADQKQDNSLFLDALEAELRRLPQAFAPETIFIGGGTPTELSDRDFGRLLEMIPRHVQTANVTEWTCEANPGTLTQSNVEMLTHSGVNRVSLGVQSFEAKNLEFLGRIHSAEEARAGYHLLRSHGMHNINIDLIYGVPGSTLETHINDVNTMIDLAPEHTSCYCLTFEEGTPLTRLRNKGYVHEVKGDEACVQYEAIRDRLARAGYRQYEISNFTKAGYECRHNLLYWSACDYIGCGPSAHSHWAGARYGNARNLKQYCEALLAGESARNFEERLHPQDKAKETLVIGLRRMEGVTRDLFKRQTGFDYEELRGPQIEKFSRLGLLQKTDNHIRLTEKGCFVSDAVFSELI